MNRSVHPAVIAAAVVLVIGIAVYFFMKSEGPPQWSASQREAAKKMLLGVNADPKKAAPSGGPSGLLGPQTTATPPTSR